MEAVWNVDSSGVGCLRQESPAERIQVPRPQVVERQIGVVLLAAIQVSIGSGARGPERIAPGVVRVRVSHGARGVGQLAYAAGAVVSIEARRPSATDELVLVYPLAAISVGPLNGTVD